MTDEDEQIARLEIHRDIIGWVIAEYTRRASEQKEQQEAVQKVIF